MTSVILYLVLAIAIGSVYCFYGSKIFYWLFAVATFLIGLFVTTSKFGTNTKGLIIGAIVGIVLVLIAKFLFKLNFFIIGAVFGGLIGYFITTLIPSIHNSSTTTLMVIVGLMLVIGFLTMHWSDVFVIISTAATGASIVASTVVFTILNISSLSTYNSSAGIYDTVQNLNHYIYNDFAKSHTILILALTGILFVVGVMKQRKKA